jgi:hypothetical protein
MGAYPELFALVGAKVPDYRGLFLRGHGSQTHAQENGSTIGVTSTAHSSGALGVVQGDAIRNIEGYAGGSDHNYGQADVSGAFFEAYETWGNPELGGASAVYMDISRVTPTSNEIRPINTAVRYFMCALP